MAKKVFLIILCVLLLLPIVLIVRADEYSEITEELKKYNELYLSQTADFQELNNKLDEIRSKVVFVEAEIIKKENQVKIGEKALSYQRGLLNERARSYYKNINKNAISLVNLLTSENLSLSLQNFFYQKTIVDQDRNAITKIVRYIKDLETKKAELVIENKSLAKINEEIDRQTKVLAEEISTTRQKVIELT